MKIKGLHIYGFGKLEDIHINDFSEGIQICYGENEAGKSTLMAFIHAVLFGFPAKNQQELRYLPKNGSKYGGKLVVETTAGRILTIERIAGKAAGDVVVMDEQGNSSSLDEVLEGMDKTMFKGIYSFNIMDVQNLKLIDSEQLGSYLFSSGLIGSDQLYKISQQLVKEQDEIFKPNGRKPAINKLLTSMKDEQKAVQQWQQKLNQYEDLQARLHTGDEQLLIVKNKKKELEENIKYLEIMLSIQPVKDKAEQLKAQLRELKNVRSFPLDGITRLEKWQTEKNFYQSKYKKMLQDVESYEQSLLELTLDDHLFKKEEEIKKIVAERANYIHLKEKWMLLKPELEDRKKEIESLKQELSWSELCDEEIVQLDTSLATKAELKALIQLYQELSIQKKRLDDQFKVVKDELEMQEERVVELEKELLPEEEELRMKQALAEQNNEKLIQEYNITEMLMSQLKKQIEIQEKEQNSNKRNSIVFSLITLGVGIISAIYLFTQNNTFMSLLILFTFLLFTGIIFKQSQKGIGIRDLQKEYREQESKLQDLRNRINASESTLLTDDYKVTLSKQEQVKQLLQKEKLLLSQCDRAYNRIVEQFEDWGKENYAFKQKWTSWAKLRMLDHIPDTSMEEAYEKVLLLKNSISALVSIEKNNNHLQQKLEEFQFKVSYLSKEVLEVDGTLSVEDTIIHFSTLKNEISVRKLKAEQLREEIEEKKEEVAILFTHYEAANKQIEMLYEQAGAEDEEYFRINNQKNTNRLELEQELSIINGQLVHLQNAYQVKHEENKPVEVWRSEKDSSQQQLLELKNEEQKLIEERSAVQETIRHLEEEGSYSDSIQQFELSKGKLQQYARKWAVYMTAQQLLNNTMEFYRNVKLPKVLEHASSHFQFLTAGKYVCIQDNELERKLVVQQKDGTIFEPKELSQATIEQLYISIRIAVATVWSEQQKFPFIMDDSFVNFDRQRSALAISLLKSLVDNGYQIIFFTCHHHIKEELMDARNAKVFEFKSNVVAGLSS
ncbi:ATP-binding protein [Sutcliffiella rhizosphaerae]|uniref:YhaN AAA domain-containing protein n=1 Tax=Sutcliffiella rhizosphaerae TaxID=2880967 RepID=A0ABM8YRE3_9BACI|nr:AAA family ATPase [Sutcliffiella rhizosphaerae]CAG9622544.1 putative protein YhaN [Sutcliffiella rhizosphaerae]